MSSPSLLSVHTAPTQVLSGEFYEATLLQVLLQMLVLWRKRKLSNHSMVTFLPELKCSLK